jgi:hypothetical protein
MSEIHVRRARFVTKGGSPSDVAAGTLLAGAAGAMVIRLPCLVRLVRLVPPQSTCCVNVGNISILMQVILSLTQKYV